MTCFDPLADILVLYFFSGGFWKILQGFPDGGGVQSFRY